MFGSAIRLYPDRLELKKGPGCLFSLFGVPFIFSGMFMLSVVVVSGDYLTFHTDFDRLVAGVMGVVFMLAGSLFSFGKSVIVVFGSTNTVGEYYELFGIRVSGDSFHLGDFNRYVIVQKGSHDFRVILEGEDDTVTLLSSRSYSLVRERTDKIAAFIPLHCDDEVQRQQAASINP